jgi:hypothetical protein
MPEKRKWARPSISYSVFPSFDFENNLVISISWSRTRKQYLIKYKKGVFSDSQEKWLDPNPDTENLMDLARKTNLPQEVEEIIGLDGTSYDLKIGKGSSAKSFDWWENLPYEWSSLVSIIRIIEKLIKDLCVESGKNKD